jgi:3-oxoacyl-(acyl-carrier-protein) synthase
MSDNLSPGIVVAGWGAVTPAGWGMEAFRGALSSGVALPPVEIKRCEASPLVMARPVPAVAERPAYFSHARLRRSPPIARFAAAAALEALGDRWEKIRGDASFRLGVVFSLMNGCVTYSRRFFAEVLENPSTASPILFPETVFNAPSSHISALLGVTGPNYTLAGDSADFLWAWMLPRNGWSMTWWMAASSLPPKNTIG